MTTRNRELASIIDDSGNITTGGNLSVTGNLTQSSSTTTTYSDGLLELNNGAGSNSNDLGLVMERGSTGDNAIFLWDESNDGFAVGTTTVTGSATGNISFSAAPFTASTITGTILNGSTSLRTPLIEFTDGDDALTIADGGLVTTSTHFSIGGSNNELRFYEGSNYVGFEAPALSADQIWVLPTADGSSGQLLKTDGSGNLSFTDDLTLANASVNNFSGDGSTTGFTLSSTPVTENTTMAYINGVYQFKNTYSVSGTTFTFDAAPANGASIEIVVWSTVAVNVPADSSVTSAKLSGNLTAPGTITANAGVIVDNITIDGTQIDLSSGDLTLDVAGKILLSADDAGTIHLYDGSLHYGSVFENNSNFVIRSIVDNEDILFQGYDDTTLTTALTLDMSDAGTAIFNHDIVLPATGRLYLDGGSDTYIYQSADNNFKFIAGTTDILSLGSNGIIFNEDSEDRDFRVESNDSANMLFVNGGDNNVSINANNTASVTNSATALAARTLIINGNESEGSDNLSVFAMADGTGNYGMEVSNSAHTAQYDLLINPIMGGNVGIGTTSANTLLHAAKGSNGSGLIDVARFQNTGTTVNDGARIQLTAGASTSGAGIGCLGDALNSAHLVFHAGGNTERMRIASSGHLLVGRTTTSVGGEGHRIDPNGESFLFANTSSALSTLHVYDTVDNAYRFYVDAAGANAGRINATQTTIQGISDIRLKENVRDLEMGMNDLMKLKPRTFDWKEGEGAQKANASGFIAQEAEAAGFEEFIGDYKHEKITDAKSFGQGGLVPLLVKCIQELEIRVKEL